MYWSRAFIPTLRETPNDPDTPGRRFLRRAGYLRNASDFLPLGQRALRKIERIAGAELEAAGGLELRVSEEDAFPKLAREIRSYKQLPQLWYRFRGAAEASRFSVAGESLSEIACRVVERCGISTAAAGPALAVFSEAGDAEFSVCTCGYAAPLDLARSATPAANYEDPASDLTPEPFHTPDRKTIADIAAFTGLPESAQMKSLVLVAHDRPALVMLRGDHQMSSAKFALLVRDPAFRPARPEEIFEWFGASAGSLGPVGVRNVPIYADLALRGRRNMIAGANRTDYHLRHVTPGEDFEPEWVDLRQAAAGEACLQCGAALEVKRGFEVARADAPAVAADVRVSDAAGKEALVYESSCAIWAERILLAAAELNHDKDGLTLPPAIAPFDVILTPVQVTDAAQMDAARALYTSCREHDLDALLDDRDERPGVKFKDADLIGAPVRITLGKKLAEGKVEIVDRRTRAIIEVGVADAPLIAARIAGREG